MDRRQSSLLRQLLYVSEGGKAGNKFCDKRKFFLSSRRILSTYGLIFGLTFRFSTPFAVCDTVDLQEFLSRSAVFAADTSSLSSDVELRIKRLDAYLSIAKYGSFWDSISDLLADRLGVKHSTQNQEYLMLTLSLDCDSQTIHRFKEWTQTQKAHGTYNDLLHAFQDV